MNFNTYPQILELFKSCWILMLRTEIGSNCSTKFLSCSSVIVHAKSLLIDTIDVKSSAS
jgi:hypothetical protein